MDAVMVSGPGAGGSGRLAAEEGDISGGGEWATAQWRPGIGGRWGMGGQWSWTRRWGRTPGVGGRGGGGADWWVVAEEGDAGSGGVDGGCGLGS